MKADLHRHLSGSISCETASIVSGITLDETRKMMTYAEDESRDYESFFTKFDIFNNIEWDRHKVDLTIHDVVWGIAQEGINYVEIKFTINKYLKFLEMSKEELIIWIAMRFEFHASKYGIEVDLVLALKHEMNKDSQLEVANLIRKDSIAECISGIDIVGNEKYFDSDFYKPIFEMWDDAGKACMLHAGAIYNTTNVFDAIK